MKLNCDLGESFGSWQMGLDAAVMPYIDMANIACGFHAGDADVMAKTLKMAKQHGIAVGAHPSYPDLQGFGRRSMALSASEIINTMRYQMAALDGMAQSAGVTISYVKPHGALYN
ncbi:MAG TPA: LamB/YcsF family protein, partial [Rheinheimera sp.]|uniref:LamB/YcsF family protein n=1 Tax=Rheinheimera sp. TaxID=1869214 RepID=UPI002F9344B2